MNRKAVRKVSTAILLAIGLLITPLAWGQGGRFEAASPAAIGSESTLDWLKALWHDILELWAGSHGSEAAGAEKVLPPPGTTNAGVCAPGEHGVVCDPDG